MTARPTRSTSTDTLLPYTTLLRSGITGGAGSFHARQCIEYGTQIVAGVTPGRGGERFDEQVPIFDTVAEAVEKTGADVSLIFVPPPAAADAIRSEEHTSELQSLMRISYAVFCLKKIK